MEPSSPTFSFTGQSPPRAAMTCRSLHLRVGTRVRVGQALTSSDVPRDVIFEFQIVLIEPACHSLMLRAWANGEYPLTSCTVSLYGQHCIQSSLRIQSDTSDRSDPRTAYLSVCIRAILVRIESQLLAWHALQDASCRSQERMVRMHALPCHEPAHARTWWASWNPSEVPSAQALVWTERRSSHTLWLSDPTPGAYFAYSPGSNTLSRILLITIYALRLFITAQKQQTYTNNAF